MVFPRVISDQQVRQSDYVTSNLVLFGTRETNAIIEKFADRLPLHLDAGAGDYGLLYIYPMNRHYLLINSGLPWWTQPKQAAGEQGLLGLSLAYGEIQHNRLGPAASPEAPVIPLSGWWEAAGNLPRDVDAGGRVESQVVHTLQEGVEAVAQTHLVEVDVATLLDRSRQVHRSVPLGLPAPEGTSAEL